MIYITFYRIGIALKEGLQNFMFPSDLALIKKGLSSLFEPKSLSAEKEGFEPPEHRCSTVFKTAAIDHSAISPLQK